MIAGRWASYGVAHYKVGISKLCLHSGSETSRSIRSVLNFFFLFFFFYYYFFFSWPFPSEV